MTHKSLFKEAAQRFVQRGQMSDAAGQTVGQAMASQSAQGHGPLQSQMNAHALSTSSGQLTTLPKPQTDR